MADTAIATQPDDTGSASPTARFDLRELARSPGARQLALLVAIAAAVAIGMAVVLWSRGPNYSLLYAGLEAQDAAAITQELGSANTPYKLGADGSSIMVPAADLAGIRLRLAAKGLPQGSAATQANQGNQSPFGMSDMAERTRFQQLLENDLGATISGLQSVRAARVHLALPRPSAFIRDNREASASVLLTLYQGRVLDQNQVAAIVHLVASSVPGLDARQVSVVDQQGRLLTTDQDNPGAVSDFRLRYATRIENTYAQRVEELLTPLVGPGRVRAQVYADVDFSQSEKATEVYGHENPALRSEQTATEQRTGSAEGPGGVPGALSNQPPAMVAQPTAANPNASGAAAGAQVTTATANRASESSSSATRNYELDRTISHVSDPAGRLARLTVAVVLDDKLVAAPAPDAQAKDKPAADAKSVPFSDAELARLTELVKNAVGFDAARGDSVSVVNQAFHRQPVADVAGPAFWERPGMLDLAKQVAGWLIALLVAFFVLRPLLKGVVRGPEPAAALPAPTPSIAVKVDDQDESEAGVDGLPGETARLAGAPQTPRYEQRIESARKMVEKDSKQVAQVVRNWVNEDAG